VPELTPRSGHTVLTKWRYNAFIRTPLAERMQAWGRDQLVVTGVYAHIGCLLTASHAFMHDVQPFLVADAVADFSRQDHVMALDYAARRCAAIVRTDEALDRLAVAPVGATR
jgi:bifunctional isochorismate lyase/aryl carrier protein